MFDKIKADNTDIDFILLTGDYVAHAIALEPPPETSFETADYDTLLEITAEVAALLTEYFPNVPVLTTQGNNDTKYHY
jgi:hypothetical protein